MSDSKTILILAA